MRFRFPPPGKIVVLLVFTSGNIAAAQEVAADTCAEARDQLAHELDGTAITVDDAPGSLLLELRAAFGPFEHRWNVGPVAPDEQGRVVVDLAVPSDAFLHELATDWVTDLSVLVTAVDDGGRGVGSYPGLDLFLAWPDGREADAVVWDRDTARSQAPWGIVAASRRALVPQDTPVTARFLPPVYHLRPAEVEPDSGRIE